MSSFLRLAYCQLCKSTVRNSANVQMNRFSRSKIRNFSLVFPTHTHTRILFTNATRRPHIIYTYRYRSNVYTLQLYTRITLLSKHRIARRRVRVRARVMALKLCMKLTLIWTCASATANSGIRCLSA